MGDVGIELAAQATHVDGVLQLTLPKVAKVNSKQITIQ